MRFFDNFRNFLSGLGVPDRDKSVSTQYCFVPMHPEQIEAAYRANWIARKAIKIPAEDMTREWRSWQAENDQITAIEAVEKKFKLPHKVRLAMIKARTYGGAGLYIGTDGDQNTPLMPESVKKDGLKFLHVFPAHHLSSAEVITDPLSEWYGEPQYYQLAGGAFSTVGAITPNTPWPNVPVRTTATAARANTGTPFAPVGSLQIHPSRIIRFIGNELPDDTMQSPMWGDSVLNTLDAAIKQAGTTMQSIAALVQEAKVDVIKIKGLAEAMSSNEYTSRMIGRFSHSNVAKSVINALLIDSEEEWDRITTNFGGMSDVLMTYLNIVAGAADIPVTRFFGRSPAGLNATGESDIRNYYDRLRSDQTSDLQPRLERLDDILIRSALGDRPEEIFYDWNSLWQNNDAETAAIEYQRAQAYKIDVDAGLIPQTALSQGRINQVIESGFYPGLEQALADAEAAGDVILTPEEEMQRQLEQQAATLKLQTQNAPPQPQPGQKFLPKPKTSDWLQRAAALLDEVKGLRARPFVADFDPEQPRDRSGKWTSGGNGELSYTDYNPHHEPAGSSKGGQFASGEGGTGEREPDEHGMRETTPEHFIRSRNKSSRSAFLSPLAPDDLLEHTLLINEDSTVGAAISKDGDIQNVFNNGGPKGGAAAAIRSAIARGGKTLDCYDGFLPAYYSNFGFAETERLTFDPQYAPKNWDFEKYDSPDVVFMKRQAA